MQTRTRRQREVLEFITRYIENHGYEPSYQMIARHLGVSSKGGIAKHVQALESQGLLTRRDRSGRFALALSSSPATEPNGVRIEWLEPAENDEAAEDWPHETFSLPPFLLGNFGGSRLFAFRVPDGLMSGKNVCEGDIALVEPRSFVRDGDTIVAELRKGPTLLRSYFRNGAKVELHTSPDDVGPVVLPADKVKVIGVYRGLLRPVR
jgi:repressor LexA